MFTISVALRPGNTEWYADFFDEETASDHLFDRYPVSDKFRHHGFLSQSVLGLVYGSGVHRFCLIHDLSLSQTQIKAESGYDDFSDDPFYSVCLDECHRQKLADRFLWIGHQYRSDLISTLSQKTQVRFLSQITNKAIERWLLSSKHRKIENRCVRK